MFLNFNECFPPQLGKTLTMKFKLSTKKKNLILYFSVSKKIELFLVNSVPEIPVRKAPSF
jgi:hypothetical protein